MLKPLLSEDEIEWSSWDVVKTNNPKTGKEISKRQLVKRQGQPSLLLAQLIKEVDFLSGHLFVAHWQQTQFRQLSKSFPPKSVVITADFAENYSCFAQNEIQGAHWAKDSITVHLTLTQYICPDCPEVVEEYVDIISNDLIHDSHAIHKFLEIIFKHLTETQNVEIEKAYILTDGCAAQYKCKIAFVDSSMACKDFGISIERAYYGSRHGKNRCDGEGGVLKSRVSRAVRNNNVVISKAKDFYDYSKSVLEKGPQNCDGTCNHNRRSILWIDTASIKHSRPDRICKTIPGTRKFHSVQGISRGLLKTRELSCFCNSCLVNGNECINKAYVDDCKVVVIKCILLLAYC